MIEMGFLKVIRTWALRDKMPIREIARRTGIARNTIKKYLREGIVEPAFQRPDRPSKLDPVCRSADRMAGFGSAQVTQRTPNGEANARRFGEVGI